MGGNCSTIQVQSGDSCASLATRCGISAADFTTYNPSSTLCSTLTPGEHVCCSAGTLPNYAPQPYDNGTCYTYHVAKGDDCSQLAAANDLTIQEIEVYNNETWGWLGCSDLQSGQNICLSPGSPPFPAPVTNAVCGPQVPGTTPTDIWTGWPDLNPCPLSACCDIWGQCGITADFCTPTNSTTGNPGTAANGTNGCISNCGTDIKSSEPPTNYAAVGYFEGFNYQRECLHMQAWSIDESQYTHIHYAFGNITSDFGVNDGGYSDNFEYFKTSLTTVKRIISFGGWDFSTSPDTYMIFRDGVTEANRATLVQNVANFLSENSLDGVDFDWEYPGEPDIEGIPAGSPDDGANYLAFLTDLRDALGTDYTISVAAPASYWYLKGFPIQQISTVVDYIVFMTYDLHGTWDLGHQYSQDGCPDGNCLRSDINITETVSSLSMITKAGVPSNMIMVGVTSYGRSFEMTDSNCYGPTCTYTSGGLEGRCTQTSGFIANAEINEIISTNPSAQQLFDTPSNTNILVYNETQWVGYMDDAIKAFRIAAYKDLNFGGTSEWAIDLEKFIPDPSTLDIADYGYSFTLPDNCDNPSADNWDASTVSEVVNAGAAYIDVFIKQLRNGDTTNWDEYIFNNINGIPAVDCSAFPDGSCPLPPQGCDNYGSKDEYWALYMIGAYYKYMSQFNALFVQSVLGDSFMLNDIVSDFPVQIPDNSLSTILSDFGVALSMAGSFLSMPLDVGPEALVALGSSSLSTVGGLLSELGTVEAPSASQMLQQLEDDLGAIFTQATTAVENALISMFQTGDLSTWPAQLVSGSYETSIANFFATGQFLYLLDGNATKSMGSQFNTSISQSLVGLCLVLDNYFILTGAHTVDDCPSIPSGSVINNTCFTLEYPGDSFEGSGPFSVPMSQDTYEALTNKYTVDINGLYTSSYACQNQSNGYGAAPPLGFNPLYFEATEYTPCFFNLPIFPVGIEDGEAWVSSPCLAMAANATAPTPIVGITYLPDNLAPIYAGGYCHCNDAACDR